MPIRMVIKAVKRPKCHTSFFDKILKFGKVKTKKILYDQVAKYTSEYFLPFLAEITMKLIKGLKRSKSFFSSNRSMV